MYKMNCENLKKIQINLKTGYKSLNEFVVASQTKLHLIFFNYLICYFLKKNKKKKTNKQKNLFV